MSNEGAKLRRKQTVLFQSFQIHCTYVSKDALLFLEIAFEACKLRSRHADLFGVFLRHIGEIVHATNAETEIDFVEEVVDVGVA